MTKVQEIIEKYVKQEFSKFAVKYTFIDNDKVKVTDHNGDSLTFTANIYGDIIDTDTNTIIATSDLPHTIDCLGQKIPETWKNV